MAIRAPEPEKSISFEKKLAIDMIALVVVFSISLAFENSHANSVFHVLPILGMMPSLIFGWAAAGIVHFLGRRIWRTLTK
jgi:hypothetical protein